MTANMQAVGCPKQLQTAAQQNARQTSELTSRLAWVCKTCSHSLNEQSELRHCVCPCRKGPVQVCWRCSDSSSLHSLLRPWWEMPTLHPRQSWRWAAETGCFPCLPFCKRSQHVFLFSLAQGRTPPPTRCVEAPLPLKKSS